MTTIHDPDLLRIFDDAATCGDMTQVIRWFDRAITQTSTNASLLYRAGRLLWEAYDFVRGHQAFTQLIERQALSPDQLLRVARCYFSAGQFGKAATVMEQACRLRRNDPDALAMLAACCERANNIDRAREIAEQVLAHDPAHARSVRLLAHLDRRAGRFDEAICRLRDQLARHQTPDDWRLRYELAAVFDRTGSYDEAFEQLSAAKQQLRPHVAEPLRRSYAVRQRQRELFNMMTREHLAIWRQRTAALIPRRIVYLAGFPRSGTTLLEQMLAVHPDCIGTDETGILRSQFVQPIVYDAASTRQAWNELCEFDTKAIDAGRDVFLRCTESFIGEPIGKRLLIEKDPLLTADLPLAFALFPEAHLLMPLRDPRDVVISYFFTMVPLNWSSAPAISLAESCLFYADVMRHWHDWRERLQQPGVVVRYEDVIAQTRQTLQRVCDELGLTWQDELLDVNRRGADRAIRTPTYHDVSQPLYTRAIGRWRHYEKYLAPAMSVLEPFIEAFGYA